jgi:hypothetical protein
MKHKAERGADCGKQSASQSTGENYANPADSEDYLTAEKVVPIYAQIRSNCIK